VLGPEGYETTEGWKKLYEELHDPCSSPSGIRSMKLAGNVARMGVRMEVLTYFLLEDLKGRDHSEDVGVGGIIKLKRNLWK
jgi:hypothetical protein